MLHHTESVVVLSLGSWRLLLHTARLLWTADERRFRSRSRYVQSSACVSSSLLVI